MFPQPIMSKSKTVTISFNYLFTPEQNQNSKLLLLCHVLGGGSRVVVSTAAFHARVRGSVPGQK